MKFISTFLFNTLILLILSSHYLAAQFQGKVYEQFTDAQVSVSGIPINSPWCGGINSVQINLADLNLDGKKDLVLYDHNNFIVKTFLNIGTSGEIKYKYAPKYELNFPSLNNYLILKDYNCDGIVDLFHKGFPGVSVYKGYYQANELKFTYFKDLYFPGAFGPVNVYVQPDDIPAIIDVDKDGDLDVVSFDVNGVFLVYTRNMRVEEGLPCDSIKMELVDNCYGKFFQGYNRTVNTGISCKGVTSDKKTRHTGNCFVLLDIEGDNDLDFLGGNISFSDAQLLINTSTSAAALYTLQDTTYNTSSGGHILKMPTWPSPFHTDIDQDGDNDILFTSHNDNSVSANYNAVAYYKNIGSDISPNFIYQHDSLLTPDMIDVGYYSYPTFFDYDKDGKKDLFIGTEGYLDNATGIQQSKIAHYKNTSNSTAISFELVTKDFLNLSSKNYPGIFPTFGDITGDGISDLVLGNKNGSIAMYKNYASSNTVTPNFLFNTDSIPNITVGSYSVPIVFDFNQDGKIDLLIGNRAGTLAYFKDTSTTPLKKLALQTISLGNFKAGATSNIYGYCAPFIGKMDNTNTEFLMIGNIDGTVARYDSFINNSGTFKRIDSNYSEIKTLGRSTPAIEDLDGDGKFEMVIGNKLGGLSYFKQVKNVPNNINDFAFSNASVELYPNPNKGWLHLLFISEIGQQNVVVKLYDIAGQLILSQSINQRANQPIDICMLSNGMYLAEILVGDQKAVKKIILDK